MVIPDSSTSNNMSTTVSPHKPTRVWKPPKSTDGASGVPSMFAHTTLTKPLKVNKAVTSTVRWRSAADDSRVPKSNAAAAKPTIPSKARSVPVSACRPGASKVQAAGAGTANSSTKVSKGSAPKQPKSEGEKTAKSPSTRENDKAATSASSSSPARPNAADFERTKVNRSHSGKINKMMVPKPKKKMTSSAAASSSSTPPNDENVAHATVILGGGSSVAGTPQSWPKPHAVPPSYQHHSHTPTITRFSKPKKRVSDKRHSGGVLDNIDELIPDMYRKSKTPEPDPELQRKMEFLWALREYEQAKEEEKLKYQPIRNDIDVALNVLKHAKKQNEDIGALLEDETSSLCSSMHSIREKLAFFTSNHSISASSSSSSSDDSSVSSWASSDSDNDVGLFRG